MSTDDRGLSVMKGLSTAQWNRVVARWSVETTFLILCIAVLATVLHDETVVWVLIALGVVVAPAIFLRLAARAKSEQRSDQPSRRTAGDDTPAEVLRALSGKQWRETIARWLFTMAALAVAVLVAATRLNDATLGWVFAVAAVPLSPLLFVSAAVQTRERGARRRLRGER